jgi:DNA polymerase-1
MATTPENVGKAIIVSDDKDLKTIPGKLYRPTADERLDITEAEADKHFYMQTLTGDSTDGYPGCPTIGQKRAEGLLGQRPAWSVVEQAFIKQGLTKADALLQARMARILRWSDWDTKKNEVKLWEPAA